MSFIKKILGNIGSRVWLIVTVVLIVLFTVVTILSFGIFSELFSQVLGDGEPIYAEGTEPIYVSEYKSKKEVYEAAQNFNVDLAREGIVLMKNDDNALPIYTPQSPTGKATTAKPKVSVFGKNSANIAYGGSGSGGFSGDTAVTLYSALEGAGYELNPQLKNFYADNNLSGDGRASNPKLGLGGTGSDEKTLYTGETEQSKYDMSVKNSYVQYKDAAFVLLTRIGGENFDLPRTMKGAIGANNEDDHFLQLDKNERELLDAVCSEGFGKVVILINSGSAMQLDFLKENRYAEKIDAVVWMGYPGENGTVALGEVLNGKTNPSGRTPDTYAADYKANPTWNNFGEYQYKTGSTNHSYYFVHYEENVYVGYKYYETRGADDDGWYSDAVVYPFGYGMSYTKFDWEVVDKHEIDGKAIAKGQNYTVKIKVTNTGSVSGKDVVQLYGNAPYKTGGIEKPYVTLLNFAKTKMLEPGKSDTVELVFNPYYLASYDYKDQNNNEFYGFELDSGNYNLFVSRNAHDDVFTIPFTSPNIQYSKDPVTNKNVVNRYTGITVNKYLNSDMQLTELLSQGNWSIPASPTSDEREVDQAFIDALKDTSHNSQVNFSGIKMPATEEDYGLELRDLLFDSEGAAYQTNDDGYPCIDYDDPAWENLLDQAIVSEMKNLQYYGAYQTKSVESIGMNSTTSGDGPVGWRNILSASSSPAIYDVCSYVAQVVVGATFNQELVEKFGRMVGDEGIIGNEKGGGKPYSGWYAPGVNIHRSPFGGRNFEYYSEDGILSGKLAAAQIRGAQSKGVACYIKHFALNEQETRRTIGGSLSWVTEQAMREIYLRPFEMAVKEGKSRAVMSSFNRIGTRWAGGDYRLLTSILREEWGFRGAVICDFNDGTPYMHPKQMAYAGGDLNLATLPVNWCNESSAADVYILRQCTKNIAYVVGNSNAMNGDIIGEKMAIWKILLIVIDCVLAAGLAVWGFFVIRNALKK